MYQTIRYEKQDGIAIVTINRPEALNALNSTVISELEQVIGEVEKDQELGAMILTGEGRSFVAGADIGEMRDLTSIRGQEVRRPRRERFPQAGEHAQAGHCSGERLRPGRRQRAVHGL